MSFIDEYHEMFFPSCQKSIQPCDTERNDEYYNMSSVTHCERQDLTDKVMMAQFSDKLEY